MRPQQRSFVVEIKSKRRTLLRPKSIWGDTNFSALAKEAEELAPEIFAASPSITNGAGAPANAGAAQDNFVAGELFIASEIKEATDPLQVRTDVSGDQLSDKSIVKPTRKRAGGMKAIALPMLSQSDHDTGADDELASLTEENIRLKRLLSEKLAVENEALRMMLSRF